jgi:DegV family protein with EDD domain
LKQKQKTMTAQKIKFVTDSVCDIPAHLIDRWEIAVVPCYVNYGGKSYADDGVELNRESYFAGLLSMPDTPTTAAPPPALAEEIILKAYEGADHLIVLTTPARLSAIHNSMRIGLGTLPPERYTLIDSGQLSMALGWQVLIGAQTAAATGSVEATLAAIARARAHQNLYAGLAMMEMLRRSGRVSWAVANVGSLLQIKPVVQVWDGEVTSAARVRTFSRVLDKLVEMALADGPYDKLALLHINNLSAVEELRARLKDILPAESFITDVGPTLGTHIGPGAIGFAGVKAAWKV